MNHKSLFSKGVVLALILCMGISCKKNNPLAKENIDYFELVSPEFNGDTAMETTAFVEQYWRVAGNTGFNATVYRIQEKLEASGYVQEDTASPEDRLTYRIEKRAMKHPTWEPVDARLSIVGMDTPLLEYATNRNMIYLNAASTPEGGVTAEVVYIKDLKELSIKNVKGKIVFAEMSPYRLFTPAIEKGGALGLLTYNNPAYLQPEKNTTSIQFRGIPMKEETKAWGMALSYAAKEKLKTALSQGKVEVYAMVQTKIYPSEELTIIANVRGSELPKESLVLSAHIQEPGANDNATGVGTQLEMAMLTAKFLKEGKLSAKRTLTFLWGDEIISTRRYIEEKEKRTAAINWGISLDMVGENTSVTGGSFLIEKMPDPSAIWTRGNDKHSEWGGEVMKIEDMKPHYLNDFIINIFEEQGRRANWQVHTNPFEGGRDHTPFLDADIPGLLLWHFTDQFYHTDNDRIDKVSQETMKNVGTAALVSVYTLINADVDTGRQLIQNTLNAATERLNTEFLLSEAAVAKGATLENEILILKTWGDWYLKSLSSITDIAPTDEGLKQEISESELGIKELTISLVEQL